MPTVEGASDEGAGDTGLKQGKQCAQVRWVFVDMEKEVDLEDVHQEVARGGCRCNSRYELQQGCLGRCCQGWNGYSIIGHNESNGSHHATFF